MNNNIFKAFLLLMLFLGLMVVSCTKPDEPTPTPVTPVVKTHDTIYWVPHRHVHYTPSNQEIDSALAQPNIEKLTIILLEWNIGANAPYDMTVPLNDTATSMIWLHRARVDIEGVVTQHQNQVNVSAPAGMLVKEIVPEGVNVGNYEKGKIPQNDAAYLTANGVPVYAVNQGKPR